MCSVKKTFKLHVTNLVKLPLFIWKPLSISQQLLNIRLKSESDEVNACKRHVDMPQANVIDKDM